MSAATTFERVSKMKKYLEYAAIAGGVAYLLDAFGLFSLKAAIQS
jgi:hypothetical protein